MTSFEYQALILKELRELRSSFNTHAADTSRRLTALEALANPEAVKLTRNRKQPTQ